MEASLGQPSHLVSAAGWLVGVLLLYHPRVQDVSCCDPLLLLWTVALPVDQVVKTPPTLAGTEQASDGEDLTTINDSG